MADQDLRYRITAEDRFSRAFANLKRDLTGAGQQLQGFQNLAGRALGIFSLGTVASIGGTAIAVGRLADQLDNLNDAADATGSAIDRFAALDRLARQNNESTDLVTNALIKLNGALKSASKDSPLALALEKIGLDAEELRRQDPADALQSVARALANYADDGNRARIVQEIFGKSTREVAGFIKDLAAASDLGSVAIGRQAAEAERFNKQLAQLRVEVSDASRSLVGELLPSLNEVFTRFRAAREVFGSFGAAVVENLNREKFAEAADGVAHYSRQLRALQAHRAAVAAGPGAKSDFGQERLAAMDREIAQLQRLQAFYVRVNNSRITGDLAGDPRNDPRAGRGFVGLPSAPDIADLKVTKDRVTEAERLLEQLERQAAGYDNLTAKEKLLFDIERNRLEGVTPQLQRALELAAQTIDDQAAAADAMTLAERRRLEIERAYNVEKEREIGFQDVLAAKRQRDIDAALELLDDTTTGRIDRATHQIDILREMLNLPGVDATRAEQIAEAIERIRDGLKEVPAEADKATVIIDRFAENTIDKLLDAAETGDLSASKLFKAFQRDVLRAVIEDPVRDAMKSVVKLIRDELGQLDGAGGPIAKLFAFLRGSSEGGGFGDIFASIGSLFGGGPTTRAGGGRVNRGSLVKWQEGNGEWFVPQENGTVITQAQLRQMGGAQVDARTYITIHGGAGGDQVATLQRQLDARDARLIRSLRYGRLSQAF